MILFLFLFRRVDIKRGIKGTIIIGEIANIKNLIEIPKPNVTPNKK